MVRDIYFWDLGGSRLTLDWSEIIVALSLILPFFSLSLLITPDCSSHCSSTWGRSSYRIKSIYTYRSGPGERVKWFLPLLLFAYLTPTKCPPPSCCDFHFCGQPFSSSFFSPFFTLFYSFVCIHCLVTFPPL